MAFIGWNPGDDREIMSMAELVEVFDINKVQKGGGAFNIEKLHWINKQYLNLLSENEFKDYIDPLFSELKSAPFYSSEMMDKITPIIRERTQHLLDVQNMITDGELDYYFVQPEINSEKIVWKNDTREGTIVHLEKALEIISSFDGELTVASAKAALWDYAEEVGKGNLLWPIRFALSGRDKSPDPFTLIATLGQTISLQRIEYALVELKKA